MTEDVEDWRDLGDDRATPGSIWE